VKEVPTIPTPLLLSYRKHKRLLQLFFSFRIKTLSIEFISAAKDLEKKKKKTNTDQGGPDALRSDTYNLKEWTYIWWSAER
jgi:hypothetical protein